MLIVWLISVVGSEFMYEVTIKFMAVRAAEYVVITIRRLTQRKPKRFKPAVRLEKL